MSGEAASTCHGGDATTPSQYFAGWMAYNRFWFHKDLFAITPGGGVMTNPGRYLTLLPPINGATAFTGTPYFPESPGTQAHQWDFTVNFQYMPKEFITFWGEWGYRHSDVAVFRGSRRRHAPGRQQWLARGLRLQHGRDCRNKRPGGRAGGVRRRAHQRVVPRSGQLAEGVFHGSPGEVLASTWTPARTGPRVDGSSPGVT